jgi:hypothetical protein
LRRCTPVLISSLHPCTSKECGSRHVTTSVTLEPSPRRHRWNTFLLSPRLTIYESRHRTGFGYWLYPVSLTLRRRQRKNMQSSFDIACGIWADSWEESWRTPGMTPGGFWADSWDDSWEDSWRNPGRTPERTPGKTPGAQDSSRSPPGVLPGGLQELSVTSHFFATTKNGKNQRKYNVPSSNSAQKTPNGVNRLLRIFL